MLQHRLIVYNCRENVSWAFLIDDVFSNDGSSLVSLCNGIRIAMSCNTIKVNIQMFKK
jgi:hypothetical protein